MTKIPNFSWGSRSEFCKGYCEVENKRHFVWFLLAGKLGKWCSGWVCDVCDWRMSSVFSLKFCIFIKQFCEISKRAQQRLYDQYEARVFGFRPLHQMWIFRVLRRFCNFSTFTSTLDSKNAWACCHGYRCTPVLIQDMMSCLGSDVTSILHLLLFQTPHR